jgi:hypothetical protein
MFKILNLDGATVCDSITSYYLSRVGCALHVTREICAILAEIIPVTRSVHIIPGYQYLLLSTHGSCDLQAASVEKTVWTNLGLVQRTQAISNAITCRAYLSTAQQHNKLSSLMSHDNQE